MINPFAISEFFPLFLLILTSVLMAILASYTMGRFHGHLKATRVKVDPTPDIFAEAELVARDEDIEATGYLDSSTAPISIQSAVFDHKLPIGAA